MANVTTSDSFDVGEQTLIRPDSHHQNNLEGSGDNSERERVERSGKTSERSEMKVREELSFKGGLGQKPRTIVLERRNPL